MYILKHQHLLIGKGAVSGTYWLLVILALINCICAQCI